MPAPGWCVLLTLLAADPVGAQEWPVTSGRDDGSGPRVVTTVGVASVFGAGFVFRGIVQELDPQLTLQPFAEVRVRMSDRWSLKAGSWNSLHTGSLRRNIGSWYAADVYAATEYRLGWLLPGAWYRFYGSPAGGYELVGEHGAPGISEVGLSLAIDDRRWLRLSPSVAAAFELSDAQADFGSRSGIYGEAAIRPSVRLSQAIHVAFPARVGISLRDYYEAFDGTAVRDHRFGYLQAGALATLPVRGRTPGSWEAQAGVTVYVFGHDRQVQQVGDDTPAAAKSTLTLGLAKRW